MSPIGIPSIRRHPPLTPSSNPEEFLSGLMLGPAPFWRQSSEDRPMPASRARLDHRQLPGSGWDRTGGEPAGDVAEALDRLGPEAVPDPGSPTFGAHPSGLPEHPEVVAHGRLRDVAAGGEVARADLVAGCELAEDRESRRVGGALEQQGVRDRWSASCAYIDIHRYRRQHLDIDILRSKGEPARDDRDHSRGGSGPLRAGSSPGAIRELLLGRAGDHRRGPLFRARAGRAAGSRRPCQPRLRQPDGGRRAPRGRARPRPGIRWRDRRPPVGEARGPDRPRHRARHDRRDAGARAAERRSRRRRQRRVPEGPDRSDPAPRRLASTS